MVMDQAKRTILCMNIDEAVEADKIFVILMGSEIMCYRCFIESHTRNENHNV